MAGELGTVGLPVHRSTPVPLGYWDGPPVPLAYLRSYSSKMLNPYMLLDEVYHNTLVVTLRLLVVLYFYFIPIIPVQFGFFFYFFNLYYYNIVEGA